MPDSDTEEKVDEFVALVEEELGIETAVDTGMDNCIGWFLIYDVPTDILSETYDADVDFELTKSGVTPLWAEVFIDDNDERRDSLGTLADQIDRDGDTLLYEYQPTDGEVDEDIISTLQEIHGEVF